MVFHSLDKVTRSVICVLAACVAQRMVLDSLFIHMYPAFLFTTLRHFHPTAEVDYPALAKLPQLDILQTVAVSSAICMVSLLFLCNWEQADYLDRFAMASTLLLLCHRQA